MGEAPDRAAAAVLVEFFEGRLMQHDVQEFTVFGEGGSEVGRNLYAVAQAPRAQGATAQLVTFNYSTLGFYTDPLADPRRSGDTGRELVYSELVLVMAYVDFLRSQRKPSKALRRLH